MNVLLLLFFTRCGSVISVSEAVFDADLAPADAEITFHREVETEIQQQNDTMDGYVVRKVNTQQICKHKYVGGTMADSSCSLTCSLHNS